MNGISGLYSFDPRPDRTALSGYVRNMAQKHEIAPWVCDRHPLVFKNADQSLSKRFSLHLTGTITNTHCIKKNLPPELRDAKTQAQILLAAIETWSLEAALDKIEGAFAFALWDQKKEGLYLVRDHMGNVPLFAAWAGSQIIFANDLNALHKHPDFSRDIDRAALTSYMRFGHVPAPLCIFEKSVLIPPGCFISIDVELVRGGQELKTMIEPYWRHKTALKKAREHPIQNEEAALKSLEKYLDHDLEKVKPTAALLSDGVSSALVTAQARRYCSSPLKTFTLKYDRTDNDAYAIADHLKTEHNDIILDPSKLSKEANRYAQSLSQPIADPSGFAMYILNQNIQDECVITGAGAGTMFGAQNHITALKNWKTINGMPANLRKPLSQLIKAVSPKYWNLLSRDPNHGADMHKFADVIQKQTEADLYLGMISTWQTPKKFITDGREQKIPLVDHENQIDNLTFVEDMLYWDSLSYNPAHALGRSPFNYKLMFEYAWSLPVEMKIDAHKSKVLLHKLLSKHMPELALTPEHKRHDPPIDHWLRTDLKDWAEDLLDPYELRSQGLLDYPHIGILWAAHKKGRGNHAQKLWTVLMFQQWYRKARVL